MTSKDFKIPYFVLVCDEKAITFTSTNCINNICKEFYTFSCRRSLTKYIICKVFFCNSANFRFICIYIWIKLSNRLGYRCRCSSRHRNTFCIGSKFTEISVFCPFTVTADCVTIRCLYFNWSLKCCCTSLIFKSRILPNLFRLNNLINLILFWRIVLCTAIHCCSIFCTILTYIVGCTCFRWQCHKEHHTYNRKHC